MSHVKAPTPLPSGYEADGLEDVASRALGTPFGWTMDWEVTAPSDGSFWIGFVHEFRSATDAAAYLVPTGRRGSRVYVYAKGDRMGSPEEAVRWMLAQERGWKPSSEVPDGPFRGCWEPHL